MESILSIHDEVYPLKSRRNKSSSYLSNYLHIRRNTLNDQTNLFSLFYQYIKTMIAQRTLYIIGILNLILAGIAIICVAHAEDHPEYFSLVYISISIFIFYMATIIFIIVLQIIETYQEQQQRHRLSLPIQMPLLTTKKIITQSKPIIVESLTTKTQAKTRLSRSHTLPLTLSSRNSDQILSTSTFKDFNQLSTSRLTLLPKNSSSNINIPKNYQSFALTTNNQFCPSYTTITNSDSNPYFSSVIKPIPVKYHVNSENNKPKIKILQS
jgi:hypothetical protein